MLRPVRVGAGLEKRLGDGAGQRGLVGALQHHDGLGGADGLNEVRLGEGLERLDGDDAHLDALRTQVGKQGAHVVGDRAEAHHDVVRVLAVVGHDGRVDAARQLGVFVHCLAHESWDRAREVGAVVDRARLEVGLVLDGAGDAGVVQVYQGGNALAGALFIGVDPLAAPLRLELRGNPLKRRVDQVAGVVGLDRVGGAVKVCAHGGERLVGEVGGVAVQVLAQLEHAALGAKEHLLRHRRRLDAAGRVAQVVAQQLGLGQ